MDETIRHLASLVETDPMAPVDGRNVALSVLRRSHTRDAVAMADELYRIARESAQGGAPTLSRDGIGYLGAVGRQLRRMCALR